ncbi:MAG: hypothetical protein WC761_00050 [Candidatus Paceibacterota bacterium]|jgi:hypothetical protein
MKPGALCSLRTRQEAFVSVFCIDYEFVDGERKEHPGFTKVPVDEPVIFLKLVNASVGLFFFVATQKYVQLFLTDVEPICFK